MAACGLGNEHGDGGVHDRVNTARSEGLKFLKKHVLGLGATASVGLLLALNRLFPASDEGRSWWWKGLGVQFLFWVLDLLNAKANRADQQIQEEAIRARLSRGDITAAEIELALTMYDRLRDPILVSARSPDGVFCQSTAFALVLHGKRREDLSTVLRNTRRINIPRNATDFTSDEIVFLLELACEEPRASSAIFKWIFVSGGLDQFDFPNRLGSFSDWENRVADALEELLDDLPKRRKAEAQVFIGRLRGRAAAKTATSWEPSVRSTALLSSALAAPSWR